MQPNRTALPSRPSKPQKKRTARAHPGNGTPGLESPGSTNICHQLMFDVCKKLDLDPVELFSRRCRGSEGLGVFLVDVAGPAQSAQSFFSGRCLPFPSFYFRFPAGHYSNCMPYHYVLIPITRTTMPCSTGGAWPAISRPIGRPENRGQC